MEITKTLCFLLLCLTTPVSAVNEINTLLKNLDDAIESRSIYLQERENRINEIKKQIQITSVDDETLYNVYGDLFEEYKAFQMDSALSIANARIAVAERIGEQNKNLIASMNLAEVLIGTGMYKEAFDILDSHSGATQAIEVLTYRYHLYHSLYVLMTNYSLAEKQKKEYKHLVIQYKDSILSVLTDQDIGYHMVRTTRLLSENRTDEALQVALDCMESFGNNEHAIAMAAYTLYEVYHQMGNREEEKKYLAISALGDIKGAVKEYISLRALAVMLYEDGDISRAYDYTKCAMEDAIFCNARLRALEISQMLPIINDSYDAKIVKEKRRLTFLLSIISVLFLFLIGAVLYIYKQLKALSAARKRLKQINLDLETVNSDLNKLNRELSESNLVKEEYIGYVFSICSNYIDKLEDFRKKTNRKLKIGQIDELLQMTNSSSLVSDELKEFHRSFDTIFLKLYPKFIEDFNSLLIPEEVIIPKEGDLLTPELRIFALVRLGISDSVKIADFLHYSTQTVYNYRLKVRNKSRIPKDDFSVAINQIGRIVM
ncbi:DUF6377 domain-containing protein [Massilibacteroides sp.]|uniref:DUF6377 domain-containing protein n=1 Tax=Massilibacteroides sp. TaxID=2034766 RepID=UPI00260EE188|nr:DUF6377 domain-containing protein [Massilibacteroides sp.]MDD4516868.1 DUF6377 domain-containing protein [Massilibacteroides sp.]